MIKRPTLFSTFVSLVALFFFVGAFHSSIGLASRFEGYSWPQGNSGVAWKAERTLFLYKKSRIDRMNTDISVRIEKLPSDYRQIFITIPIDKFNFDGALERFFLPRYLLASKRPNIEFQSVEMNREHWDNLLAGRIQSIRGNIITGAGAPPVNFEIRIAFIKENPFIDGFIQTTFTHLKIDPPSLLFGLIAKADNRISLMSRIYLKDIKGFEDKLNFENIGSKKNDRSKSSKKHK